MTCRASPRIRAYRSARASAPRGHPPDMMVTSGSRQESSLSRSAAIRAKSSNERDPATIRLNTDITPFTLIHDRWWRDPRRAGAATALSGPSARAADHVKVPRRGRLQALDLDLVCRLCFPPFPFVPLTSNFFLGARLAVGVRRLCRTCLTIRHGRPPQVGRTGRGKAPQGRAAQLAKRSVPAHDTSGLHRAPAMLATGCAIYGADVERLSPFPPLNHPLGDGFSRTTGGEGGATF